MRDDVIVEVRRHEKIVFEVVVRGELTNCDQTRSSRHNACPVHELPHALTPHHAPEPVQRVTVAGRDVMDVFIRRYKYM